MRRLLSVLISYSAFLFMALAPQSASALSTFTLAFSGPGLYIPPGFTCSPPYPLPPGCEPSTIWWQGTAILVTTGDADGTYTGDSFVSIAIDSNLFSATSPGLGFDNGVPNALMPASVTLTNGVVTSFNVIFNDQPNFQIATFAGMQAGYFFGGAHHGPEVSAGAVVFNVPEPETYSLMLAGLLLTSLVRRRMKAIQCGR